MTPGAATQQVLGGAGALEGLFVWLPVAATTAVLMELWASLLHGRVWHGPLWAVHRSHHRRSTGGLEANDALSILHVPIAIALIVYGSLAGPGLAGDLPFGVGVGMTLFGVSYFVVHDGLIHGRLPVGALGRLSYFARVKRAHEEHHRLGRGPYGLFFGPWALARARARRARGQGVGSSPDSRAAASLVRVGQGLGR